MVVRKEASVTLLCTAHFTLTLEYVPVVIRKEASVTLTCTGNPISPVPWGAYGGKIKMLQLVWLVQPVLPFIPSAPPSLTAVLPLGQMMKLDCFSYSHMC